MKEQFQDLRFTRPSMAMIQKAIEIIDEYQEQGFTLTLRQLYYQFVARGLFENKIQNYKKLGSNLSRARLAGIIGWDAIEDRTRNLRAVPTWEKPEDIIKQSADRFALDPWVDQDYYPEVWIEKDALLGVIQPVCSRWRVPFFACRGYTSQSEQWNAGKRFQNAISEGKQPIVLHLGDHDPSGLDMTRDNEERLTMFAWDEVQVNRLALNMDQVKRYRPPPNPTKDKDSRSPNYRRLFGGSSWELDALDPKQIDRLVEDALQDIVDQKRFDAVIAQERVHVNKLQKLSKHYAKATKAIARLK